MKKIICELPTDLVELFAISLNGYGIEIINRDEKNTIFAIYAEKSEEKTLKETIFEIFEELGNGKIILEEEIKEENWEEKWKEYFKPIKIPPFIIIPEWEIYEGKDLLPIKIKVAQAFGTGLHATTQLVLSLLPEFIEKGYSVLDIGTGTGILAIASAKLGASEVYAIDIHDKAVEECRINSWENEVNVKCEEKSIEDIKGSFDVVLANLQIEVFRQKFKYIPALFKKYLIVSGIFKEKEREEFLKMAKEKNLKLVREEKKPEAPEKPQDLWYAFVFKHS